MRDCHFMDQGAQLIGSEVQAVEVGQAVLALNLIHTELNRTESVVLFVLQISEGDLEDTALQGVISVLQTTRAVNQSLTDAVGKLSKHN
ncbi:40S ribosomal protein S3aE [Penicillium sp. IBT 18751x]|nr:40S ribosomal protein S3aE [Penicillium sp. IBT 18751x]